MFVLTDIQACEPEALPAVDGVTVTVDVERDDTSAGCARVSIAAPTREAILDYVQLNWGTADGDWFEDYIVRRITEVPGGFVTPETDPVFAATLGQFHKQIAEQAQHRTDEYDEAEKLFGPDLYVVTESAEDPSLNPCWVGRAANPVDALNRYVRKMGHAGYDNEESRSEVGVWASDEYGADAAGAFAAFTNTTIYSFPLNEGAVQLDGEDDQPADRTILVHVALRVTNFAPSAQVVLQHIEGALEVGLEGADDIGILNVEVTGEEV